MSVKQGDRFETAEKETIMVTYTDNNKTSFRFIHGSTRADSIATDVFEEFIANGYFKEVKA